MAFPTRHKGGSKPSRKVNPEIMQSSRVQESLAILRKLDREKRAGKGG